MYESPIEMTYRDIQTQIREETDKQIIEAVRQCGICVDKEELLKALQYDRRQYEKGYNDGLAVRWNAEHIMQIIEDTEYIQQSRESDYTKEQSKINAYDEIVKLIKGEG